VAAQYYTQVGEEQTADFFDGSASAPANWYSDWGTNVATHGKGSTVLGTPEGASRVILTESQPSADINRLVATMTSGAGATVTEAGVFDASTSGNMVFVADFTGVVLGAGDKIEFTWDATWA